MRIEILGTRANIWSRALHYARHAGVLIDECILLDLGELAYLRRRPRQTFITHLHPDHAAFLKRGMASRCPFVVKCPDVQGGIPRYYEFLIAAARIDHAKLGTVYW